tara:strand:+ start:720 stop:971 length:252 start_codon:yes stop_codon:yes gene_type:complete
MSLQSDAKKALELMNSGQWLQLEGSVGRWVQGFIDAEYLVQDYDKTKKLGPVKFVDGYGRPQQQYWAKINWEKVHDDEWGYDG